jgi:hypothetical protein
MAARSNRLSLVGHYLSESIVLVGIADWILSDKKLIFVKVEERGYRLKKRRRRAGETGYLVSHSVRC